MSEADLWQAIRYLHLLAMAFFVGGQILVAVTVVPIERLNPDPERLRAIAKRFGLGSLVALVVLAGTGAAMASRYELWESGELRAKLALVSLVIALAFAHLARPRVHLLQAAILVASLAIVWLGLDLAR